jgi:hypothetical protein
LKRGKTMGWEDDRITCDGCDKFVVKTVKESMPDHVMEKFMFMNHSGNRWMFPIVKIHDKVATLVYKRRTCTMGTGVGPFAKGMKHRCDHFCKIDAKSNVEGDAWWD